MFQFQSPGAVFLKLGSLTIRWYGVMIALGFLLASLALTQLTKRFKLDSEKVINCALIVFIGGIIGARLYFVALSWPYFHDHLMDIWATWKGGMSIHGGIIGGAIAGSLYCRKNKLPTLQYTDLIGTVAPLAQAIGRWGNFFNSEAFGRPVASDYFLRLYIPPENRPALYLNNTYFHPTFLYESIWDLALFALLYYMILPKMRKYPGTTFCIYLAGYSLGRLLIEPLRVDSIMLVNAPAPIIVSSVSLIGSFIMLAYLFNKYRHSPKGNKDNEKSVT